MEVSLEVGFTNKIYNLKKNMKLLLYCHNNGIHHKIFMSLERMCLSCGIDFEKTSALKRLKTFDYHFLISSNYFIHPKNFPKHIKIMYGPQLFVVPEGKVVEKRIQKYASHCVLNCLSEWVKTYWFEFANDFVVPVAALPFSIETSKFKPTDTPKQYDCLVYFKRRHTDLLHFATEQLSHKGLSFNVLTYGSYDEEKYLDLLQKSKFLLSLDAHESQGYALQEAMSCNVPLLVLDSTSMYDEVDNQNVSTYKKHKPKQLFATSVPYWSEECGIKITDHRELSGAIDYMMVNGLFFTPRNYVLNTLSDKVCMKRFLHYFNLQPEVCWKKNI